MRSPREWELRVQKGGPETEPRGFLSIEAGKETLSGDCGNWRQTAWTAWAFGTIRRQSWLWSPSLQGQGPGLVPCVQSAFSPNGTNLLLGWESCPPPLRGVCCFSRSELDVDLCPCLLSFFLFLFFFLKHFIMLKCTEIKRHNGRPRLPTWIWFLGIQTQT